MHRLCNVMGMPAQRIGLISFLTRVLPHGLMAANIWGLPHGPIALLMKSEDIYWLPDASATWTISTTSMLMEPENLIDSWINHLFQILINLPVPAAPSMIDASTYFECYVYYL